MAHRLQRELGTFEIVKFPMCCPYLMSLSPFQLMTIWMAIIEMKEA